MIELDTIAQADALEWLRTLPDESVNCMITSPPYFGLRDYNAAGQIGLEDTLPAFIARLVAVFHEARRVLRSDGVLFCNMGDTYCSSWGSGRQSKIGNPSRTNRVDTRTGSGLKEKDLMGVPWRLAFALQDDGWYLRSDIIWHKPNPMPESVTDRPTKSHEYVFLLTKSARYWYDADAIREPHAEPERGKGEIENNSFTFGDNYRDLKSRVRLYNPAGRNKRSVWSIATEPSSLPHYATFPQKLIEPMILAGCPAQVCAECGAPFERVTEREYISKAIYTGQENGRYEKGRGRNVTRMGDGVNVTTLGFRPTCTCDTTATRPGIVLDMFGGTGTTGYVARRLGRHYLLCDLSAEYVAIAQERLANSDPYCSSEIADGIIQPSLFENIDIK